MYGGRIIVIPDYMAQTVQITAVAYTQQNSYSISHLLDTVTTLTGQWLLKTAGSTVTELQMAV